MSTDRLALISLLVAKCLAYGLTAGIIVKREGLKAWFKEPITLGLVLYTAAASVWGLLQVTGQNLAWQNA